MSPSPAHAGTKPRAEADLPQAGKELPSCRAGAGRAARSGWARGTQAVGHCGDAMGQTSVSSVWPAGSFASLGSGALWSRGLGNKATRICTCSWRRKNNAVIYSKCLPPPYLCCGDKPCFFLSLVACTGNLFSRLLGTYFGFLTSELSDNTGD